MNLWNPTSFFISLIMSLVMALIFATPMGMPIDICIYLWPIRWLVAYLLMNIFVFETSFRLAVKIFNFNGKPGKIWNPLAFFISFIMSMIMPAIFGVLTNSLPVDIFIYLIPVRWAVAYCMANFIANPIGFKLAEKVFGFKPQH